jgi:hypothetical protein
MRRSKNFRRSWERPRVARARIDDDELRLTLSILDPLTRDALRLVLIHDQADRDAVSSQLLRYRDGHGDDWADIIDMLTMHPEERRRVVRLLGEIQAARLSKDPPCDCL